MFQFFLFSGESLNPPATSGMSLYVRGHSYLGQQVYTFNSTFTWPTGIGRALVECWGGGGGPNSVPGMGGGGGGGAYARKWVTKTSGVDPVYVGIGAGLNADGKPSYYREASLVYADFGRKGLVDLGGIGGITANCIGDVVYPGGSGGYYVLTTPTISGMSSQFYFGGGGGGGAGDATTGRNTSNNVGGAGGTIQVNGSGGSVLSDERNPMFGND